MCSEISKWTSKQIHSVQKDLDEVFKLKNLYWHTLCCEQNNITAASGNPNHQALWGMDSKLHLKSKSRLLKLLFLTKELVPLSLISSFKENKNHTEIFINYIVLKMVLRRKSTACTWSKPIKLAVIQALALGRYLLCELFQVLLFYINISTFILLSDWF